MTGNGYLFYGLFQTDKDSEHEDPAFLNKFVEGILVFPGGKKAYIGRFNGTNFLGGDTVFL